MTTHNDANAPTKCPNCGGDRAYAEQWTHCVDNWHREGNLGKHAPASIWQADRKELEKHMLEVKTTQRSADPPEMDLDPPASAPTAETVTVDGVTWTPEYVEPEYVDGVCSLPGANCWSNGTRMAQEAEHRMLDHIAAITRQLADAQATIARLKDFARDVATNYDHDADAHRYNTGCRTCSAEKELAALAPSQEGTSNA